MNKLNDKIIMCLYAARYQNIEAASMAANVILDANHPEFGKEIAILKDKKTPYFYLVDIYSSAFTADNTMQILSHAIDVIIKENTDEST